ncbi:MAG TPA: sigma-70 family RNA polymerase sigma factor [Bryobacteraceae bacterium]|jgi:RNA polymerase sigma-70 factor (ECF subfamily)|nr:sigma-70 family RNA polymerase sigma factor [Bryobacteraceae bacterium]
MTNHTIPNEKALYEAAVTDQFLSNPTEESFSALFNVFAPQLVSFFRTRSRESEVAEDLAQEVMLTVYLKAGQIRDRALFRSWLFKVAHNALCRHYGKVTRGLETVNLADVDNSLVAASYQGGGTPAFEFRNWMAFLDAQERDVMTLRFVEQWEYHEIAAARDTPIGTVQWRVFNSKKKLARHLMSCEEQSAAPPQSKPRNQSRNSGERAFEPGQSRHPARSRAIRPAA